MRGVLGLYDSNDERVGQEVFLCNCLDLGQCDRFVAGVVGVAVVIAQAVEFVEGGAYGVAAQVLAGNLALADDLGLGAFEFFGRYAFRTKEFGFLEEFGFNQGGLVGRGAGVESEIAGREANDILGAHVIGQAELLADA